jgi:hypothetical protein
MKTQAIQAQTHPQYSINNNKSIQQHKTTSSSTFQHYGPEKQKGSSSSIPAPFTSIMVIYGL